MNLQELTMLLTRIQVLDNRQVDALTIEAWEPLVGDLDYDVAVTAVNEHFASSKEYLRPVHVRDLAAAVRRRQFLGARRSIHEPHWVSRLGRRVCEICGLDESDHTPDRMCPGHDFDAVSGYCAHCGVRDDRVGSFS